MSKLERLQTFVMVVEENSFSAASKRLKISNVAVTKQINALEADLGVQLLLRTTRKLNLTEAGRLCYEHAKTLSYQVQELEGAFSAMRAEPIGSLKVGCAPYMAQNYIIPHLSEFLKLYPKISLSLELNERIVDLAKERVDINIGHNLQAITSDTQDIVRSVGSTRYVLCASPTYLERFGIPKKPKDLIKHRYITHSTRNPDNLLIFDNGVEVILKPYLGINDSRLMKFYAIQGEGIIKLHHYVLANELKEGKLIEILHGFDTNIFQIYLGYQPFKHMQTKIRHFIDFFIPKINITDYE